MQEARQMQARGTRIPALTRGQIVELEGFQFEVVRFNKATVVLRPLPVETVLGKRYSRDIVREMAAKGR